MSDPIVTVVMPAYNAERWIEPALSSACGQTLRDLEILVVDDGSTDATPECVKQRVSKDDRIRLIQIENAGVGAARNVGIRAARGRYIAPLDADDVWAPEKLEKQVRRMEEGGERTGLVYCWQHYVDELGQSEGRYYALDFEGDARRALILQNFVGCASVPLFRAGALRQVGIYLTREDQGGAQGCEDWDLSMRVAERFQVGVVREVLVDYRQVHSAMSARAGGMTESFRILMKRARRRNPDLPPLLFRCARGHFYSFLARKSYRNGDFRGSFVSAVRAAQSDPATLLDQSLLRLAAKGLIQVASGGAVRGMRSGRRHREAASGERADASASVSLPRRSLFRKIQARRWERVLGTSL